MRKKRKNPWDINRDANILGIDPDFFTNDDRAELIRLLTKIQDLPEQESKAALLKFTESQHRRQIELSWQLHTSPEGQYHTMRSVVIRGFLLALLFAAGAAIFFAAEDGFLRVTALVTFIILALFFFVVRANQVRIWQYYCISFLPNTYARRFIKLLKQSYVLS